MDEIKLDASEIGKPQHPIGLLATLCGVNESEVPDALQRGKDTGKTSSQGPLSIIQLDNGDYLWINKHGLPCTLKREARVTGTVECTLSIGKAEDHD